MTFPDFVEFFEECTGHRPYPWQIELARRACRGEWPEIVDVPTGLGKTATLLVAVYAAVYQASGRHSRPRVVPQRIVHVVNRRSVVDQTQDEVARWCERAVGIDGFGEALTALAGPWGRIDPAQLYVGRVHGEAPDSPDRLRPAGVQVVTMTPQQLVSRLLFRGYGVSSRTRSIHAGLLGVDTLIVFDEPHLAVQAVMTVRDVLAIQERTAPRTMLGVPSSRLVLLGATVPGHVGSPEGDRLTTTRDDERHPVAAALLTGRKPVELVRGLTSETAVRRLLVGAYEQRRQDLGPEAPIAVIANTIAMAQDVFRDIVERQGDDATEVRLLTSRMRSADRLRPTRGAIPPTIVSTQGLEVGVDLSFDAIVTELAPYPALQQRLGRLNRHGGSPSGDLARRAVVVLGADLAHVRPGSEAVYGATPLVATARLLDKLSEGDSLDLSLRRQVEIAKDHAVEVGACWPDAPRTATFHSGYLGVMAQTYPTPWSDLPVASFVAGPDERSLDVLVAWRAEPSLLGDCPVLPGEQVSVPLPALRSMLHGHAGAGVGDVDAWPQARPPRETSGPTPEVWVRRDRHWQKSSVARIVPGDEVVLRTSAGGYTSELGWRPTSRAAVQDVSLEVALACPPAAGAPRVVGLSEKTVTSWFDRRELRERSEPRSEPDGEAGRTHRQRFLKMLADIVADEELLDLPETLAELIENAPLDLAIDPTLPVTVDGDALVVSLRSPDVASPRSPTGAGRGPVLLDAHGEQVGAVAWATATAVGLLPEIVDDVTLAGRWHDEGKRDPRYQAYLRGRVTLAEDDTEVWAKSRRGVAGRSFERRCRDLAGLPRHWRHEVLSAWVCAERGYPVLVVYLAGSHHGQCRPLIGERGEQLDDPRVVEAFDRLQTEYGPWGLAYLEAVVRLSDWYASERPALRIELPDFEALRPTAASSPPVGRHRTDEGVLLTGLAITPVTGWFAVAGLLRVAAEMPEVEAFVRWPRGSEPLWWSSVDLEEICELLVSSPQWRAVERYGLRVKNQKFLGDTALSELIREADRAGDWMTTAILRDASPREDSGQVPFGLPARPNNSSYVGTALAGRAGGGAALFASLLSIEAGWGSIPCDGGMDRSGFDRGVTGREVKGSRQTRVDLAPAALTGMASMGAVGADGLGVRGGQLVLPCPDRWVGWPELVALTHGVGAELVPTLAYEKAPGATPKEVLWVPRSPR